MVVGHTLAPSVRLPSAVELAKEATSGLGIPLAGGIRGAADRQPGAAWLLSGFVREVIGSAMIGYFDSRACRNDPTVQVLSKINHREGIVFFDSSWQISNQILM